MKNVSPGVHGRNFKPKRGGFRSSVDGDVRVGAHRQRTPWDARASGCAREHTYHRETSVEGTLERRRARWGGSNYQGFAKPVCENKLAKSSKFCLGFSALINDVNRITAFICHLQTRIRDSYGKFPRSRRSGPHILINLYISTCRTPGVDYCTLYG